METLKLNELPVIFICPDHNAKYHERRLHMESLLQRLGFKHVKMYKSTSEAYPMCLLKAHYNVLKDILDHEGPYLVLEDDVEVTKWYTNEFHWPQDSDAFYLGLSKCGASYFKDSHAGPSDIEHISDHHIRILNMLTLHAVVYISKEYKLACMKALEPFALQSRAFNVDVLLARLHKDFRVYAYYKPYLYQTKRLGNTSHVEKMTYFEFEKTMTLVTAFYPLSKSKHTLRNYMNWASIFFKCVTVPVICYCDATIHPSLKKYAGPNVTFQVRPLESWTYASKEWMSKWEAYWHTDREKEKHCPELYAIWASKISFILDAIQKHDSDAYIWCDIGAWRTPHRGDFKYLWQHITSDKMTCLKLFDTSEQTMTIGGGLLVGNKSSWASFAKQYHDELVKDIDGKDQRIFRRILTSDTANCIEAPKDWPEWKQWFYLTYLFSDETYLF